MNGTEERKPRGRLAMAGMLAAGLLAGGILAGSQLANAAGSSSSGSSGSSSTGTTSTGTSNQAPKMDPAKMTHGPGETLLTGSAATKAKDAALKAVPGATVIRVETDSDGAAYEAHLQKADGSYVTVKVNKQFEVTETDDGFGGGPGGMHGGPGMPPPGSGSDSGSSNGSTGSTGTN